MLQVMSRKKKKKKKEASVILYVCDTTKLYELIYSNLFLCLSENGECKI